MSTTHLLICHKHFIGSIGHLLATIRHVAHFMRRMHFAGDEVSPVVRPTNKQCLPHLRVTTLYRPIRHFAVSCLYPVASLVAEHFVFVCSTLRTAPGDVASVGAQLK